MVLATPPCGSDDQALQVGSLLGVGIADLRIFGDREVSARGTAPDHFTVPEIVPPSVTVTTL